MSGSEYLKGKTMVHPFSYCPVNCKYSWKKTDIKEIKEVDLMMSVDIIKYLNKNKIIKDGMNKFRCAH